MSAEVGQTGLARLQAIVDGRAPQPPIGGPLGFQLAAVGEGTALFRGTPAEAYYNPLGVVHGGWACTLLDSAMGCAVLSTLDEQTAYTTAQLSINLVRPITVATGPVVADARVVHRGGRMATAEGWLRDAAGTLLAHATTTCAIFPRR